MPIQTSNLETEKKKRTIKLLGFVFLAPLLFSFLLGFGVSRFHDFKLWQMERDLNALQHPPNSQLVSNSKEIGLMGNSNHCDFLVTELRSFSGPQAAVKAAYKNQRIAVPNADSSQGVVNGKQTVDVEFLPSPLPANYEWKYHAGSPWNLSSAAGKKNLYIITVFNVGESNDFGSMCDSRCK